MSALAGLIQNTRTRLASRSLWPAVPWLLIVAAWAFFLLHGFASSPGYYIDEGYAADLMKGFREGHFGGSVYYRPLAAYMPGHRLMLWILSPLFFDPILAGRFLSAVFVLAAAALLYGGFRKSLGSAGALALALVFLSYEQTAVLGRMGIPHVLMGIGILILFFRDPPRSWQVVLGGLICFWNHQFALFVFAVFGLLNLTRIRPLIALVATGFFSLLIYYLGLSGPERGFLPDDLSLNAADSRNAEGINLPLILRVIWMYHTQDFLHLLAAAAAGWGVLKRDRGSIAYLLLTAAIIYQRQNILVFNYPDIMFLPLAAALIGRAGGWLRELASTRFPQYQGLAKPAIALILIVLLMIQTAAVWPKIQAFELRQRFQRWATADMGEFRAVAAWVNEHITPADLVLATPTIGAVLKCPTADWLTMTSHQGYPTTFMPRPWPRERLTTDLSLDRIQYVVVSDSDFVWTLGQPNVSKIAEKVEKWPVAYATERFIVLRNPARSDEGPLLPGSAP